MGRGSKSQGKEEAKGKRAPPAKGSLAVQDLEKLGHDSSEEEDEHRLDAFQDKRGKVNLEVSNDEDEDDQEDEKGIMVSSVCVCVCVCVCLALRWVCCCDASSRGHGGTLVCTGLCAP